MAKLALVASTAALVAAGNVTIYKEDYPIVGMCGQESGVKDSWINSHYFFPLVFGGFHVGNCSDIGYTKYNQTKVVEKSPIPWRHHNLTFDVYERTQTRTTDIELVDPSRKRTVTAKVCMPEGKGPFPLYLFGHGAGCAPEDYEYFCQVAATVMIYQKSPAGPIFPVDFDSATAALDAAFLAEHIPKQAAGTPTSPFFGRLDGTVILGGHSMGGGMTVLAAGMDGAKIDGVAMFAPGLYTKPDATPFLRNISAPALVVSGSMDCGSNALDKQAQPAFDGLASESKVLVVLKGANHCQWTIPLEPYLGVCKTFEKNECHNIDRADQHRLGSRLVMAFSKALKSDKGWAAFEELLASGEAAGTWTYVSSKTSEHGKTLHNDCDECSSSSAEQTVLV